MLSYGESHTLLLKSLVFVCRKIQIMIFRLHFAFRRPTWAEWRQHPRPFSISNSITFYLANICTSRWVISTTLDYFLSFLGPMQQLNIVVYILYSLTVKYSAWMIIFVQVSYLSVWNWTWARNSEINHLEYLYSKKVIFLWKIDFLVSGRFLPHDKLGAK